MYKPERYNVEGLDLEAYIHECVYEPSDDSILGVKLLVHLARRGLGFNRILDIGTGSGILALAAAKLFNPAILVAIDVNPYAVEAARMTLNGLGLVARCDSTSCLRPGMLWDLVLLNPPYLPVEDSSSGCSGFRELAWSGGSLLPRLCRESASIARSMLVVYSSLSPIDVEGCLKARGFRIKYSVWQDFFMERLRALYAVRDDWEWIS